MMNLLASYRLWRARRYIEKNFATPISPERALLEAVKIDDHFDRLEFLQAWIHGDWETCEMLMEPEQDATQANNKG